MGIWLAATRPFELRSRGPDGTMKRDRGRPGHWLWAVALVLLLAGCGQPAEPGATPTRESMSEITITQADNGRTVEARQGDTITVRLDENPTTGYSWAVDSADPAALALQDTDYAAAPNSGDIVGGGGERQLRFKAIGPGTAELRLKHWREWEGDTSIVERFNVTVQVR